MQPIKSRLAFLDAYRGFAILWVVLFHIVYAAYGTIRFPTSGLFYDFTQPPHGATFYLVYPLCFGWAGVAIFFVISGFCIHLSHTTSDRPSWITFFERRAWRILPPYFVALFFFAAIWTGTRMWLPATPMRKLQLLSHFFLVHNLDERTLLGINASFWSIAVEVQLYLLYPLMLSLWKRAGCGRGLLLIGGIEFALRLVNVAWWHVASSPLPHHLQFLPFNYWGSWALGAYLAERYRTNRPLVPHIAWAWGLGGLFVVGSHFSTVVYFSFMVMAALTFVLMARALFLPSPTAAGLDESHALGRHLRTAGIVSYSIYLFHQPLCQAAVALYKDYLPAASPFQLVLLGAPLWWPLVWGGRLLFRFLEQPANAMGRRGLAAPASIRKAA
jgi:peptidoglycan/LPS O-acetylase OafA/YrhL